ncbi:hypothetical protein [Streptomyces lydicus]|uniref:hypothetical protein n=1 Tax=Streptomyces lydicus TaxID=47763 RepID=UPI0037A8078C
MPARHLAAAAALVLASAVPAAAAAPAHPYQPAGSTEVPVERGSARLRLSPDLRSALKEDGVVVAGVDAKGRISPRGHSGEGTTLRLTGGAVTNSGGKLGGELRFGKAGLALVATGSGTGGTQSRSSRKSVTVTRFEVDLGHGILTAALHNGTRFTLGTFPRPATRSAVNTKTRSLRVDLTIKATASAARLDAALGTHCFTGHRPLLHARIVASLERSVDVRTALNLGQHGWPDADRARTRSVVSGAPVRMPVSGVPLFR